MNPPDPIDQPELTHYALGELPAHQHRHWDQALSLDPRLQAELVGTHDVIDSLRAEAPLFSGHLLHDQRQRVLAAAAAVPARRPIPIGHRHPKATNRRPRWTVLSLLSRSAAVVALAAASFWLGQNSRFDRTAGPVPVTSAAPPPPTPSAKTTSPLPSPVIAESVTPLPIPAAAPVRHAEPAPAVTPPPPGHDSPTPTLATIQVIQSPPAPASTPLKSVHHLSDQAFVDASRHAQSVQVLVPRQILPPNPIPPSDRQFAKPVSPAELSPSAPVTRTGSSPPLFIHAWRSEVASCPWNPDHRLLRISIQLPADQPAAIHGQHDFPAHLHFDANNVRSYRFIGSQSHPASALRHAGQHILWYEFQPNGAPADARRGTGKHIARLEIPHVRFTTQSTGPFSSRELTVLDDGLDWKAARSAFRLDAAHIGLALLLDGSPHRGHLSAPLVLDLLPEGDSSASASRDRLVRALNQLTDLSDFQPPLGP